ncbi:BTB/POZ domain-containing protein [Ceratocystis lukuohia]|uniref:BTB/POZ domain-containing protein n=1 Tax=Ceratocystis lukuohia TaxID=2019550 RepID=A0ABR4MTE5_9PEZI
MCDKTSSREASLVPIIDASIAKIPPYLPHERVFPIQIGTRLFKLSGASISSDAPSYFSQWFKCKIQEAGEQNLDFSTIPTLYIDRDPDTFSDIALHLQGYHIHPRDGMHFVRLFADAQFYKLPKLISQLNDESIFISLGGREFNIPRELFTSPENSPNYFSLGFAMFFSKPEEIFPGLERVGLLRPPSILPPSVPHRSADVFEDILKLLRGYPLEIRNEQHRGALLRDVRYFNFKGLEQKLIPHSITFNLRRQKMEIVVRLEDILKSGLSVARNTADMNQNVHTTWANYARPLVDKESMELVVEIGSEQTRLRFEPNGDVRAQFYGIANAKVGKLLSILAGKMKLPPHILDGGVGEVHITSSTEGTSLPSIKAFSDELKVMIGMTIQWKHLTAARHGRDKGQDKAMGLALKTQKSGLSRKGNGGSGYKALRTQQGL